MKSRLFLSIATLSLLVAGCNNNDFEGNGLLGGNTTVKATMEQKGSTRSLVDDNGKFTWAAGDVISVFTSTGGNREFVLASGEGEVQATFNGTLVNDETMTGCAVYPYNAAHQLSGNMLTVTMPAEYGDFTTDYAPNTHAIMVAKIEGAQTQASLGNLDFKHLGGVLRFAIDNMPADAAQFVFTATDKDVTGTFTVDISETEPVINAVSSATTNNTVTIKFKPLTEATDGMIFYVPLPVGTYDGFSIAVQKQDGTELASFTTQKSNTLDRRTLARIPKLRFTSVDGSLETAEADVSSNAEVEAALGKIEDTVTDPVLDLNASSEVTTFTLPAAFTSNATTSSELNINYAAVPSSILVTEYGYSGDASVSSSKGEVNISIPAAIGENAPDVTIQTPTLTTGLYAAEDGTATYGTVTATTANNTLIVGDGVTINSLTVKGGNVRVKGNATISQLENATGGTLYVIKEGSTANVPTGVANVEIIDAATYDLMMACANGGDCTLTGNVTGDFVVSASEAVVINLNGFTITNKSGDTFTVNQGSMLTIAGNGTVDNVTHQKACIYNNGTVVLEGGTYTRSKEASTSTGSANGNSYYNILNHGEMTINAGVTISSTGAFSSLIDNGYYNYTSTNERTGYVEGKGQARPSLLIKGGSFSGGINTIKNDDGATLTIEDGTFANTTQATVQNNNVATISGGVYNPTNSAADAVQTRYFAGGNNAGETTISGGIFNGNMYMEGASASLKISGGTFSDPNALAYLTSGANVQVELAKDVVMSKSISLDVPATVGINLSEKTLSFAQGALVTIKQADVTFSNGNIVAEALSSEVEDLIEVGTSGTVTLDKVNLTTNGCGIGTAISENYSKIVVKNSTINVPVYAISTNASTPVPSGVEIELSGSTFTGSDPLLLNIPATISIDDCNMTGSVHGMILRGGTATVKNSTITLNYTDDDYQTISSYFDNQNWGSGNMLNVAALTIGNKAPGAYQYPTTISLMNTKVICNQSEYIPALYGYANSGDGLGVTLTYDEQCQFTGELVYGSTNIVVNGEAVTPGK